MLTLSIHLAEIPTSAQNFANTVGQNPALILTLCHNRKWSQTMITKACSPCSWLPCWRGQLIVHCTLLRELREWFFNYFVVRQILQFVSQTVERCFHLPIMLLNLFMDFFHLFVNLLHIFVNFFVNIFYILIQLFQKVGCRTIVVAAVVIWSWEFLLRLLSYH